MSLPDKHILLKYKKKSIQHILNQFEQIMLPTENFQPFAFFIIRHAFGSILNIFVFFSILTLPLQWHPMSAQLYQKQGHHLVTVDELLRIWSLKSPQHLQAYELKA